MGRNHWLAVVSRLFIYFGFCQIITKICNKTIVPVMGKDGLQNISIMFFYQEDEARKFFDTATDYIKRNPSFGAKIDKVHHVFVNGTDAIKLVTNLCKEFDEIIKHDKGQKPDIAIDFTRTGVASEAVKLVLKVTNTPPVAGIFGQEGDIKSWRDIEGKNAEKYLVQVSPPADLLLQAVRSIADKQCMTNVALLFNGTQFETRHKQKTLLKNLPELKKHIITKLKENQTSIKMQIKKLVDANITNFFIASTSSDISRVLKEASIMKDKKNGSLFSKHYAWYSMSLEDETPSCTDCKGNVTLIHLSPKLIKDDARSKSSIRLILSRMSAYRLNIYSLTNRFYFDLAVNAILAVKKMKRNGNWTVDSNKNETMKCVNKETFDDTLELDLYPTLKSEGDENLLGTFKLEKNGRNYPQFKVDIEKFVFQGNINQTISKELLGVWKTGFGGSNLIIGEIGKSSDWN